MSCKQKKFLTEVIGSENSMTEIQLNLANLLSVLSLYLLNIIFPEETEGFVISKEFKT